MVWHGIGPSGTAYAAVATGDWGYMSPNPFGGETWHAMGPSGTAYSVV